VFDARARSLWEEFLFNQTKSGLYKYRKVTAYLKKKIIHLIVNVYCDNESNETPAIPAEEPIKHG
jgi:hypothetical protein